MKITLLIANQINGKQVGCVSKYKIFQVILIPFLIVCIFVSIKHGDRAPMIFFSLAFGFVLYQVFKGFKSNSCDNKEQED